MNCKTCGSETQMLICGDCMLDDHRIAILTIKRQAQDKRHARAFKKMRRPSDSNDQAQAFGGR